MAIAPDHSTYVPAPVFGRVLGRFSELACPEKFTVEGQMRSSPVTPLGSGDMFPSATACQEAVIAASYELGTVLQPDAVGVLHG
jgi:hypothetical protein